MTSYRNPWYKPNTAFSGPEYFQTEAKPTEYRGYLIYNRIRHEVWDIVRDGICVAQRAGIGGAKRCVDEILSREDGDA